MIRGTPQFAPWLEDPDPDEDWDAEDHAEMRRRLRKYFGKNVKDDAELEDRKPFDEDLHPRDEEGKFANTGAGAGSTTPTTRYHTLKREYWKQAQARGYLDPKSYGMKQGIWTSSHTAQWYNEKYGHPDMPLLQPDEVELEITLPEKLYREPPGGGTGDRVTLRRIPMSSIVERTYEGGTVKYEKPRDLDLRPGVPLPSQSGYMQIGKGGYKERIIEVFVNPPVSTVKRIARESTTRTALLKPEHSVRAVRDEAGNVYVWKAEDAIHMEVINTLIDDHRIRDTDSAQWWLHEGKLGGEFPGSGTGQHEVYVKQAGEWLEAGKTNAANAVKVSKRGKRASEESRTIPPMENEVVPVPEHHTRNVTKIANSVAVEFGYDTSLLKIDTTAKHYNIGDDPNEAMATASLGTFEITVYPHNVFTGMESLEKTVRGTMVHEIGHVKFQTVRRAIAAEKKLAAETPGMATPLAARFDKHKTPAALEARRKGDGVSPYSAEYWTDFEVEKDRSKDRDLYFLAQHETIAEMMRIKDKTGKLKGTPAWVSYYNDIMLTFDELQAEKGLLTGGQLEILARQRKSK